MLIAQKYLPKKFPKFEKVDFKKRSLLQIMNSVDKMPKVLLNGSKIISMEFRNLKFIDSLSFLPMALDKFTKTFDIKELKKGYFPHKFNLPKNQNYIGPMPDKKYYDVDYMTESKLKDFLR